MSVFVDILNPGNKAPEVVVTDEFAELIFKKKSQGLVAKVGDETTLKRKTLKDASITGVITEPDEDSVNITVNTKTVVRSQFDVEGDGSLNLDIDLQGLPKNGKAHFSKNTINGSNNDDSIKFSSALVGGGNTVNLGVGADSVTFKKSTRLRGQNDFDLGVDGDADVIKFFTENGSIIGPGVPPFGPKTIFKNFGVEDRLIVKNANGDDVVYTQADLKQYEIDNPNGYIQFEFLDN